MHVSLRGIGRGCILTLSSTDEAEHAAPSIESRHGFPTVLAVQAERLRCMCYSNGSGAERQARQERRFWCVVVQPIRKYIEE